MKTIITSVCSFLFIFSAISQNQVILYEKEFDGAELSITQDWDAWGQQGIWNDKVSAIHVPEGWEVVIYEHNHFEGASLRISGDWSAKRDNYTWLNRISSIKVVRPQEDMNLSVIFSAYTRWGGNNGKWERISDMTLTSLGYVYWGKTALLNVNVHDDQSFSWTREGGNSTNGRVWIKESQLSGWVQYPGEGKLDFRGEVLDVLFHEPPAACK